MDNLIVLVGGVFCFGLGLVALAVAGHGLWLIGAAVVRAVSGSAASGRQVQGRTCSACGAPHGVFGGQCAYCGFQPNLAPAAQRKSDLRAMARVLVRWREEGVLSHEQFRRLEAILQAQQASSGEPIAPPSVADPPVVMAPPVVAAPPVLMASRDAGPPMESVAPGLAPAATMATEITFLEEPQEAMLVEAEVVRASPAKTPMAVQPPVPPVTVHPLDKNYPADDLRAAGPTFSDRARRRLADVLTAFMEEKNIRWGEVVAGLLIVGSAIGCVVSLQETLREADPYVPAGLLMLATAAIYGAGVYTLRRWDLQSVSRAVLIIALLLIPLNFLAATSPGEKRAVTDPFYLLAVAVGLGMLGSITWFASRTLTRDASVRLTAAVMGASASQLYLSRLASPQMGIAVATLLFALPVGAFLFAVVGQTWQASRWKALSPRRAEQSFIVAGVAIFALFTAFGLMMQRSGNVLRAAEWLSPTMSLAAAAVVALGLAVAARAATAAQGPMRAAALAIALLGASLMVANLGLAWPEPALLITVGLLSFAALAALAAAFRQPALHGSAMACLTIAFVVGFHLAQQEAYDAELGRRLLSLLWMGRTSASLMALGLVSLLSGWGLARGGRAGDGAWYAGAGLVLMALSAALALGVGFLDGPDAHWTTPLLALYALGLLAAAIARGVPAAAVGGSLLGLAASIHGLAVNESLRGALREAVLLPERPVLAATLMTMMACMTLAWATFAWARRRERDAVLPSWEQLPKAFEPAAMLASLREPAANGRLHVASTLSLAAVVFSFLAAPFALWLRGASAAPNVAYWALIAVAWFAAAWLHRRPALMSACGWAATAAVLYGGLAFAQQQAWWNGSLLHPRHLQIQFCLIAVACVAWSGVRRGVERSETWRRLLNPPWAHADQVALGAAVIGLVGLTAAACLPGVAAEMGVEDPQSLLIGDASPALVYDGVGWLALALVVMALIAALLEKVSLTGLVGLVVALAAAPLLAAAPAAEEAATASACRWGFAIYGVALCAAICSRRPILAAGERIAWLRRDPQPAFAVETLRAASFLLTLTPIFGLTLLAAVRFLGENEPVGPWAGSWLAALSPAVLYAGPMLALVAILTAYAIRERAESYLMFGSALFQTTVTLACLLALSPLADAVRLRVELLQWNAVALAAFALLWLALGSWIRWRDAARPGWPNLLQLQLALAAVAVAVLGAWAAGSVFLAPASPATALPHLGGILSYASLLLAVASGAWWIGREQGAGWRHMTAGALVVLGALAAASTSLWASPQAWTGYYVLAGSWTTVMLLMTGWTLAPLRSSILARMAGGRGDNASNSGPLTQTHVAGGAATVCATVLGVAVVVLAMGASTNDPLRPWWSAGPTLLAAVCAGLLSVARDRRGYSYAGTALTALAATFVAIGPFIGLWVRHNAVAMLELIEANILAVAAAASVSLTYTLVCGSRESRRSPYFAPPVHAVVAFGATGVLALVAFPCLILASLDSPSSVYIGNLMGVLAALSLGSLLIASLWETHGRYALPCLYVWGAVVVALGLDHLPLGFSQMVLAATIAASSYVMLTGLLWRSGIGVAKLGARLGVPEPVEGLKRVSTWLPGLNALQALPWTLLALGMVLGFADRGMRFGAALVPLLLAIGVSSLAQQKRREAMQLWALTLATLAAVFLGWADIPPGAAAAVWLARCVRLLIVLAAVAAFYGGVVVRLLGEEHAWRGAVRRMTVANGVAALASLCLVLMLEWALFDRIQGVAGIEGPEIFAVALVLMGLIAALISLALLPKRDPLSLSEEQRMWYVYTAEVVAALLFAHVYMTMPQLFTGVFSKYWAYIVVAIAYAGVGVGELFRRSGVRVLAEPLGKTGAFLPLLPALAIWGQTSLTSYAGVLFWVGLLYVVLTIQHRSVLYGVAAGLAGNAALWALMQDRDFTFLEHPQFWLIPPAVSALVATHLTRDQLKESQLAAVRYLAMLVIYLSSTGEIFITGMGESLWPVMALATLSVLGVLAGIGLRVRAFLYLGAGFLTLSVLSIVWHAAKAFQHVWPWFAFLFVLGVAILVLFALFEKRRDAFLQKIQKLQTWEL